MKQNEEKLSNRMKNQNWKYRIIPISHINDLRKAITGLLENGLINKDLFEDQLSFFSFYPPKDLPNAQSIIVIAIPTPQMRIFFYYRGKRLPVIIPPTYVSYTARTEYAQAIFSERLKQEGYILTSSQLPLKTLAVCSGLAKYGRNNICYIEGWGSFFQLVGAFSDMPYENDPWSKPEMLDRCNSCSACRQKCPTKAIPDDRFLLRAEICLTYYNESATGFPEWIDPAWHNCLFGCMLCQLICPENKNVRNWIEDRVTFTEEETNKLLECVPKYQLPDEMRIKLNSLEINEGYLMLCRNLSVLLQKQM
jgi:epoxyqueuosine reductase